MVSPAALSPAALSPEQLRPEELSPAGRQQQTRTERARAIGLFRYQLIREAADPTHSTKHRGLLIRAIAQADHTDPFGRRIRVSRKPWTGGSGTGVRVGSTRWCPAHVNPTSAPRPR